MTINSALTLIGHELYDFETELLVAIRSDIEETTDLCSHLAQAGGKRLRPALCFMGAYGGKNKQQVMKVAIAIEIIHMAALIHDDVIDQATFRRGVPTIHMSLGPHRAVLSGDFLFARAFSLIAQEGLTNVVQALSDVLCSLSEGEILQEHSLYNCDQTETDYLKRIGKKTADFISASCRLGALTAEFPPERALSLGQYGYALGMAFQITDDILDIMASSHQLGKPTGNDLRQGNLTLPIIHALRNSSQGDELRLLINTRELSGVKLDQCLTIIRESGSIEYAYQWAQHFLKVAKDCLPTDLESVVYDALTAVAEEIGRRDC